MINKLHVGCGNDYRSDFINLDYGKRHKTDVEFDLENIPLARLPFPGDRFEHMLMSHVLEHLSNPLAVMQELHRVMKPGGTIEIHVPYGSSDNAFEDPTHKRNYFLGSWQYFSQAAYQRADYGYRGDWRITNRTLRIAKHSPAYHMQEDLPNALRLAMTGRNVVDEMSALLTAVKPIRKPKDASEKAPISFMFV